MIYVLVATVADVAGRAKGIMGYESHVRFVLDKMGDDR